MAEHEAEHLLESPGLCPGLPERNNDNISLRLWLHPAFSSWCSWTVFRECGHEFLRWVEWNQYFKPDDTSPRIRCAEVELPPNLLCDQLLAGLETVVIPAFVPIPIGGCDGETKGVYVRDFLLTSSFQWWSVFPPSWMPLDTWFTETVACMEQLLPPIESRRGCDPTH